MIKAIPLPISITDSGSFCSATAGINSTRKKSQNTNNRLRTKKEITSLGSNLDFRNKNTKRTKEKMMNIKAKEPKELACSMSLNILVL